MKLKTTCTSLGPSKREAKDIGQILCKCNGGLVIFPVFDGGNMTPTFVPESANGQISSKIFDDLKIRFQSMGCNQLITVGKDGKSIVIDLT